MKIKSLLAAVALVGSVVSAPMAAPIIGGYVIADGGSVTATFLGQAAGYTSDLYLVINANDSQYVFTNHTTPVGSTANLGNFAAGQELEFFIYVRNTGNTFYTGPGSRNTDGVAHAVVDGDFAGGTATYVGFEDLLGGGDLDYDDLYFSFSNTSGSTTPGNPAVPEPGTLALLGLGLIGMTVVARRKRAK